MATASKATKPVAAKSPKTAAGLEVLSAEGFADVPWLMHGFSTRQGGVSTCYGGRSLNLGLTHDDPASKVERNRALFLPGRGRDRCNWQNLAAGASETGALGHRAPHRPSPGQAPGGRWFDYEYSRTAAGNQDGRLRAGADRRCQAPSCGSVSRGLAWHSRANRRERGGRNAAAVRQRAAGSACRDWTMHTKMLLLGRV